MQGGTTPTSGPSGQHRARWREHPRQPHAGEIGDQTGERQVSTETAARERTSDVEGVGTSLGAGGLGTAGSSGCANSGESRRTGEMHSRWVYGDTPGAWCVPRWGSPWGVPRFCRGEANRPKLTPLVGIDSRDREGTKPRFVPSLFSCPCRRGLRRRALRPRLARAELDAKAIVQALEELGVDLAHPRLGQTLQFADLAHGKLFPVLEVDDPILLLGEPLGHEPQ